VLSIPDNSLPNVNDLSPDRLLVEINDSTELPESLRKQIVVAVRAAARFRGILEGEIGVAVVDDAAIEVINRQHLDHDYPTDVISFGYGLRENHGAGELIVSRETAEREAHRLGWTLESELLLYVIHGTLHICGLEDTTREDRQIMRHAEQTVLAELGIENAQRFSPDSGDPASSQGCQQ